MERKTRNDERICDYLIVAGRVLAKRLVVDNEPTGGGEEGWPIPGPLVRPEIRKEPGGCA